MIRARVSAYRYKGPHSWWDPRLRQLVKGHQHWDWRYVIKVNGLTVAYRQGFCSWQACMDSLGRKFPEVEASLKSYLFERESQ